MLLSFADLSLVEVIASKSATHPTILRATCAVSRDGAALDANDKGRTDVNLTPEQSDAFAAIIADESALATFAQTGSVTLPNGGQRGKPVATGPTIASLAAVAVEAAAKAAAKVAAREARKAAKA